MLGSRHNKHFLIWSKLNLQPNTSMRKAILVIWTDLGQQKNATSS